MEIKSKTTTYTLSQKEIKTLMAEKLGIPESRITIKYNLKSVGGGCDRMGYSNDSWKEFDNLEIIVDNKGT